MLIRKKALVEWTAECQQAFEQLKRLCSHTPILAYANYQKPFKLHTYVSEKGLEFLALKRSVTERFHEYLYGRHFEVYTDNNPLTYILTTAKLDATGQMWVPGLANYTFKIFYRSGKLNVEADALSQILGENTQVDHMAPLIVKTMLQSNLVMNVDIPEVYPQLKVIQ